MQNGILSKSVIGGVLIAVAGTIYLSIPEKIIGAIFFSVGLLCILVTHQNLFTGKVPYMKIKDVWSILVILLGNWFGAYFIGLIVRNVKPELIEKARDICNKKLSESALELIVFSVLCELMVYFAVEGYKRGSEFAVILCASTFVVLGFEHSIANIFYFSLAGINEVRFLLINAFFNGIGGIFINRLARERTKKE